MLENRKYVIIGVFCLVGLTYLARLFYLQVLDDTYSLGASKNSIKRIIEIPYRGQVYDRNNQLLVDNAPVYDLYVTPKKTRIADTLAFCRLMDITRQEFDSLMHLANEYSPVKSSLFLRRISKEDFARIQDALVDYRGFTPVISSVRTYPAHTLANVLGYVSEVTKKELDAQEYPYYRQGDYVGHNGLEQFYEEQLRGRRGVKFVMQNVRGVNKGSWKNGAYDTTAVAGRNLITSIDAGLQQFGDSLMQHKVGAIIAIEPASGEILAAVSAPTYDPEILSVQSFSKSYRALLQNPYRPLINRTVMASYRPGSTFKLVQALVAQQEGSLTPNMVYSHAGSPMRCHCRGNQDLRGAVGHSCNPYFYQVFKHMVYNNPERNSFKSSAIGVRKWHSMVEKFGFGKKLGIDLPSELKGNLPDVAFYDKMYKGANKWQFSYISSLSIGEGELLINPMKLANLAATIANRGWYITPHFVKGFGQAGRQVPTVFQQKHQTDINPAFFTPVIDGMKIAIVSGSAKSANLWSIDMYGKTGTSQNAKFGHRYDHSVFLGFAPRDNPQIAVAVFVENAGWGGDVAAPIAALMVERYLNGKTLSKGLANRLMNAWYLPPLEGIPANPIRRPMVRNPRSRDKNQTPTPIEPLSPAAIVHPTNLPKPPDEP